MVPWHPGARLWFARQDRLWVTSGNLWTLWVLDQGLWHRAGAGPGTLAAQPPLAMGLTLPPRKGEDPVRQTAPLDRAAWEDLPAAAPPWPPCDPQWTWWGPDLAATAWDQRWGPAAATLPVERQRRSLLKAYHADWLAAFELRASVRGWLGDGPEVALREAAEVGWIWVGDRVIMVRLQPTERLKTVKRTLRMP